MASEAEVERGPSQAPVVRRTANHIYEHCSSITVIGMEADGDTRAILQLGRDMAELADGSTRGVSNIQTIRHTFATVSIDREAAEQLIEALSGVLSSRADEPE